MIPPLLGHIPRVKNVRSLSELYEKGGHEVSLIHNEKRVNYTINYYACDHCETIFAFVISHRARWRNLLVLNEHVYYAGYTDYAGGSCDDAIIKSVVE